MGPPLFNGKKKCLGEPTREMNSASENQGIRNSSFGMTVLGLFQMGCNCFQGSQPGHLHLCRASGDLERDFWSRDLGWFGISHEVDSFLVLFFSHLQCDGLKLDKFFEEKNPSQFGAWFLS